jgi:hypothetical protein
MDTHETHCTLNAVLYAQKNGMILLTFLSNCSQYLQPLDKAVFGPFKFRLAACKNDWLVNCPEKHVQPT